MNEYKWVGWGGVGWAFVAFLVFLVLNSCASVPTGMILVRENKLDLLIREYTQQQEQLQELKTLKEWKAKMFF